MRHIKKILFVLIVLAASYIAYDYQNLINDGKKNLAKYPALREVLKILYPEEFMRADWDRVSALGTRDNTSDLIEDLPEYRKGKFVAGSGFFINRTDILTNSFIANECKVIEFISNGDYLQATIKVTSKQKGGLTLLTSSHLHSTYAPIHYTDDFNIGDAVGIAGYTKEHYHFTMSRLESFNNNAMKASDLTYHALIVDSSTFSGGSGSAVIDNTGGIVGMLHTLIVPEDSSTPPNQALAVNADTLRNFLNTHDIVHEVKKRTGKPITAMSLRRQIEQNTVPVFCYK